MGKQQDWFVSAYVFLFLSLASEINCTSQQNVKDKDVINKLPGQPSINFKQYGGYVPVDKSGKRFFYYYFVEAIKANSSPLVIWFNGGPGCSSLKGALTENGPFRIQSDGKTLFRNPYSWNKEANMLYLESPADVGFSYTNTPKMQYIQEEQGKMTTNNNYVFLVNWLERFPEYKGREVYLTGQSFAGHSIPQLAQMVMHHNNHTFINLRGILMGNPGLDIQVEEDKLEFYVQRGLASREMVENLKRLCAYKGKDVDDERKCREANENFSRMGKYLQEYNIYAPFKCLNETLTSKPKKHTSVMDYDPCDLIYLEAYLNKANVQEVMHASNNTKLPFYWTQCNHDIKNDWDLDDYSASMLPILHELMENGVRIFIYSGDVDSAVSVTATMSTLKKMNLTVENEWHPWFTEREVGGYTEKYKSNFTFATVRGAGHNVPTDQPIRALTIFTSFIRNINLPLS
ncbi:hypothetical protein AALP_AA5G083800 [Arabis alpina]|uniref:Uncharacterized protein n=1 Tax=Arabis alpina TaxID=50452 RepID=A0A087GVQ5_ARAAL|nr:hypothetical protein AALP_AA5G083800 [Arabis alpina]